MAITKALQWRLAGTNHSGRVPTDLTRYIGRGIQVDPGLHELGGRSLVKGTAVGHVSVVCRVEATFADGNDWRSAGAEVGGVVGAAETATGR